MLTIKTFVEYSGMLLEEKIERIRKEKIYATTRQESIADDNTTVWKL